MLQRLLPSPVLVACFFILPLLLTAYYWLTRYSSKVMTTGEISFSDFQNRFLATFFFSQAWVTWFNGLLDFAIWGVVAAGVLILIWAFGAVRDALSRHYSSQTLINQGHSRMSHHSRFWGAAAIKFLLVVVGLYCLVALLVRFIPELEHSVEWAVYDTSGTAIIDVLLAILKIVGLQYLIALCIITFTHINGE